VRFVGSVQCKNLNPKDGEECETAWEAKQKTFFEAENGKPTGHSSEAKSRKRLSRRAGAFQRLPDPLEPAEQHARYVTKKERLMVLS